MGAARPAHPGFQQVKVENSVGQPSAGKKGLRLGFSAIVFLALLALALAWVSSGFRSLSGWLSFLVVLVIGAGILMLGWVCLQASERTSSATRILPGWLAVLLVGAALLRLALGVIWFVALPTYGHGTRAENSGYVMADAYSRDQAAWKLANSGKSLWVAFRNNRTVDQYGGMLFLSAGVYRLVGGNTHAPLQMVVITAAFSSLAVIFTWATARRAWDETDARIAAWGVALYPEAVLLGSSQMREAFASSLFIAGFYGLLLLTQSRSRLGLAWITAALLLMVPISPPYATLLLGGLMLTFLWMEAPLLKKWSGWHRWSWLLILAVTVVVLGGLWLGLKQFAPETVQNPIELVNWWLKKSVDYQSHLVERASGRIQLIFDNTPQWIHLPLLVAYGIAQPFLPAALIAISQAPLWTAIAIWRSLGWALLLPFLVYAPLRAFGRFGGRIQNAGFTRALVVLVWAGILIASLRAAGDQWDNVRYRAVFAPLQIMLASWVLVLQRRTPDRWLRRALVLVGSVMIWFIPWYLRRYFHLPWPVTDVFRILGLGIATGVLLNLALWVWEQPGDLTNSSSTGNESQPHDNHPVL
jgi:hypothetical protein